MVLIEDFFWGSFVGRRRSGEGKWIDGYMDERTDIYCMNLWLESINRQMMDYRKTRGMMDG